MKRPLLRFGSHTKGGESKRNSAILFKVNKADCETVLNGHRVSELNPEPIHSSAGLEAVESKCKAKPNNADCIVKTYHKTPSDFLSRDAFHFALFVFAMLESKPRASYMLSKHFATNLYPQPSFHFLC